MRPNLFQFATSELSQDAFLCWLLSWANTEHEKDDSYLHIIGKDFLKLIYKKANISFPINISSIEVRKQDGGIDILCIINNETIILIEDKVGSKQHSDQLPRYKDYVFNKLGFDVKNVILVYIQTGDQSDYREVLKHGYLVVERHDLLSILEGHNGKIAREKSDILESFSDKLRRTEDEVQSFLTLPLEQWSWNSWKGFYTSLQNNLNDGNWDYVSNPNGGFLGFWWYFDATDECEIYLQLEQEKFCFKISVDNAERRRELREYWYNRIVLKCQNHGIKAKRPDRFGNGQYMTVAILDQEFRALTDNGLIDMPETLKIIRTAQAVLDDCFVFENQDCLKQKEEGIFS